MAEIATAKDLRKVLDSTDVAGACRKISKFLKLAAKPGPQWTLFKQGFVSILDTLFGDYKDREGWLSQCGGDRECSGALCRLFSSKGPLFTILFQNSGRESKTGLEMPWRWLPISTQKKLGSGYPLEHLPPLYREKKITRQKKTVRFSLIEYFMVRFAMAVDSQRSRIRARQQKQRALGRAIRNSIRERQLKHLNAAVRKFAQSSHNWQITYQGLLADYLKCFFPQDQGVPWRREWYTVLMVLTEVWLSENIAAIDSVYYHPSVAHLHSIERLLAHLSIIPHNRRQDVGVVLQAPLFEFLYCALTGWDVNRSKRFSHIISIYLIATQPWLAKFFHRTLVERGKRVWDQRRGGVFAQAASSFVSSGPAGGGGNLLVPICLSTDRIARALYNSNWKNYVTKNHAFYTILLVELLRVTRSNLAYCQTSTDQVGLLRQVLRVYESEELRRLLAEIERDWERHMRVFSPQRSTGPKPLHIALRQSCHKRYTLFEARMPFRVVNKKVCEDVRELCFDVRGLQTRLFGERWIRALEKKSTDGPQAARGDRKARSTAPRSNGGLSAIVKQLVDRVWGGGNAKSAAHRGETALDAFVQSSANVFELAGDFQSEIAARVKLLKASPLRKGKRRSSRSRSARDGDPDDANIIQVRRGQLFESEWDPPQAAHEFWIMLVLLHDLARYIKRKQGHAPPLRWLASVEHNKLYVLLALAFVFWLAVSKSFIYACFAFFFIGWWFFLH